MRALTFAKRNGTEILRDPINLFFGIGFPVVLILLLTAIQSSVPVSLFEPESLIPGVTVFGLSFMTLFSATIISRDRGSSLLQRLYTTPMTPADFIVGYALPILPLAVCQSVVCYAVGLALGLRFTTGILYAVLMIVPVSVLYVALGLLCGSLFTDKQVGGICGALLTNLSAWLSGVWFDLELVGGVFKRIAGVLPFVHAVELERAVLSGDFSSVLTDLLWVIGYAVVLFILAVLAFLRQMRRQ